MLTTARRSRKRAKLKRTSEVNVHMFKWSGHAGNPHMGNILHLQPTNLAGVTLANECLDVSLEAGPVEVLMQQR
jgi:hypothetical protein